MRVEKEILFINPDIYEGEKSTSQIADIPVNYPIPTNTPNTQVGGVNNNLLDLEIEPINTPTPSTTTTTSTTTSSSPSTSTSPSPSSSTTTSPSSSTTTTPTSSTTPSTSGTTSAKSSKNMKYLLYGGGALVVIIAYKLLFSNKEN